MFWDRFSGLCSEKNMRPGKVASLIGLSNSITTKWKNTNAIPNGDILIRISEYFDVTVDYLLGLSDDKHKPIPEDELDREILERMAKLSPAEQERVAIFIEGMIASRK